MRRGKFLVAILAAIATFAILSAFVHRPYGWHHGWGWRHHHHYYDDHREHDRRHMDRERSSTDRPGNDSLETEDSITTY
jgi:hypothetical protein